MMVYVSPNKSGTEVSPCRFCLAKMIDLFVLLIRIKGVSSMAADALRQ